MAITHNASLNMALSVATTRDDLASVGSESPTTHRAFNLSKTLNSSSTPAVTKRFCGEFTGTQNFDLTALADEQLGTVDATGLKLQAVLVNNLSSTDDVTLSDGAADPYQINGGNDLVVPPGGSLELYFADQLADVAAGAKAIDFTPAAGESFQVMMVFG